MHWLIDGHNLIGRMPNLRLNDPHDEAELLAYLRRFRARTGHQITVFFDPGSAYHPANRQKQGGVAIRFAPHGKTADQLIIRRLEQVKNPQAVAVVTSDRRIQQAARLARVRVVTSAEFSQQLLALDEPSSTPDKAQSDISLSEEEVREWLEIFKKRRSS